ncbi:MAG: hypothetical protein Q7S88_00405 [Candidatus Daviesbacteria bacterium]|nr:hypothetical protein [Candidatus Daviesbacteria bacterium]
MEKARSPQQRGFLNGENMDRETKMVIDQQLESVVIERVTPGMLLNASIIAMSGSKRLVDTFPVEVGRIEDGIATVIDFGPPRRVLVRAPVDQIRSGRIGEYLKFNLPEPEDNPYPRVK